MATRIELETELAKIGWRIEKSGNGLNDYIINHFGERTSFVVQHDSLEVRKNLFGGDTSMSRGNFHLQLDKIEVRSEATFYGEEIEWVSLGLGEHNFIQFYNHEKNGKEFLEQF